MAYEHQKDVFAPDSWKRLAFTENSLLRTKELTRYVQKVIDAEKSTDLTYLNLYIDASNDVARRYVINPKMDRIVYPGTWRPVGNAIVNPQLPGYSQTLRLGFAQAIAWDEAFIVGGKAQKTYERDIAIEFRNYDPSSIDAGILSLLSQSPVTNPVIDANTFTGKWYITGAEPRQEEDGSYTITAALAYVQTCANLSALTAMTALRESTRDVDHAFGFAGGYTAHNSVSNRDGIILTYRRIDPASRDVVSAFTDAELQSLLSAGEQATFEFVKKDFAEQPDDHTYTLRVAFARVHRRAWAIGSPDVVNYGNQGTPRETVDREWLGYQKSDLATILAALVNGGSKDDLTGYVVTSVRYSDNDDGSLNFTQALQRETKGALSSEIEPYQKTAFQPHGILPSACYLERMTIINDNLESRSNAYATPSATYGLFKLVDTKDDLLGNGLWAVTYIYEKPTFVPWADAAPDLVQYDNEGTKAQAQKRYWFAIQNSDKAAAIAALVNGGAVGAPVGWVVGSVDVTDNANGSLTFVQSIIEMVRGSLNSEIEEYKKRWVDVHGFKYGTVNSVTIINRNLKDKASAYLVLSSLFAGYVQTDYAESHQGNGLWAITATYEKVEWNAWTNAACDIEDYVNQGTSSELRRRTWMRIRKADMGAAINALVNGGTVGAPTGWVVGSIDTTDNKDGSINLTQNTIEMVRGSNGNNLEEYDKKWVDVFGFKSGTSETVRIINRNLKLKTDAYTGLASSNTGYTQTDYNEQLQGDGLWTIILTYQKMTWAAWTNSVPDTIDYIDEGTVAEAQRRTWMRIKNADMATAIAALMNGGTVGAPVGWVVKNIDTSDNKDGSVNLTQLIAKMVRGSSGAEIEEYDKKWIDRFGFQYGTTETVRIVNRNLKSKTDRYDAVSSQFAAYTQVGYDEQLQGDGLWTVTVTYQQVVWVQWTNATPDLTQYANESTPAETRTRTWFRIRNSDMATAITALLSGGTVGAPSGWTVSRVTTSDNKDGSINLEQTIALMTRGAASTELEEYNKQWIDRHGLKSGTIERVTIVNKGLKAKSDAYSALSAGYATYSQTAHTESLDSDGLWSVGNTYEFVTWNAWVAGSTADVVDKYHETTRYEQHIRTWLRIKNADLAAAKLELATGTAGYVVTSLRHDDNKDGSFNIVQVEQFAETWNGTPVATYKTEERGIDQWGTKTTIYTYVSYVATVSSMGAAHANVKATYAPTASNIINIDINDRGNGIFDVVVTKTSGSGITLPGWAALGVEWHPLIVDQSGRHYNLAILRTSSYNEAYAFSKGAGSGNGASPYGALTTGFSIVYRDEPVKEVGSNLWLAKRLEIYTGNTY